LGIQEAQKPLDQTYNLVVRVVIFGKNNPVENILVRIFRLEKEPISPQQWVENLRNGAPFKRLITSKNTDKNGIVTTELAIGTYEVKIDELALAKTIDLTQNDEVLIIEPKKHWWV
jgi:hypothetical protein